MFVQINTDKHIVTDAALTERIEAAIAGALEHFSEQVTRVEVHVSDENGPDKSGARDKRCVMELRLAGRQPIIASDQAPTIAQAVDGAADKMKRQVVSALGRLSART